MAIAKSWRIYWAFRNGDHDLSTEFLANSGTADPKVEIESAVGFYSDTALHLACRYGWLHEIKLLIEEKGCVPEVKDCGGQTPLHYACHYGHLNIVHYLISLQNCDATAATLDHWTPLHYACRYGHLDIVEYLFSIPGVTSSVDQQMVLHLACKYGHHDILAYLMDKLQDIAPDPSVGSSKQTTGLLHTACRYGHTQIVKHLCDRWHQNQKSFSFEECKAIFIFCCKNGQLDILKQVGFEAAYFIDKSGKSGLHYACQEGHTAVAKYIIEECGCDINKCDRDGLTPLLVAIQYSHIKTVKYLLSRPECDAFLSVSNDNTVLHFAYNHSGETLLEKLFSTYQWSDLECTDIIKMLLVTKQWDPNSCCNSKGDTALHLSLRHHRPKVVHFLLSEAGCDANVKNHNEETLLNLMLSNCQWSDSECTDTIKILMTIKQWDPTAGGNFKGDTALHFSAQHHRPRVVKFLISEAGCDPNVRNHNGETPLQLSAHHEVISILVCHGAKVQTNNDTMGRLLTNSINGKESVCLDTLKSIIKTKQWDPNSMCNVSGDTALHLASQTYRPRLLHFLLTETGCDPNAKNFNKQTPLHLATHPKIMELLVYHGAKVQLNDTIMHRLLASSAEWQDSACLDTLKMIMDVKQLYPNLPCDSNSDTVLHLSAEHHQPGVIQYLISEAGCDPNIRNYDGETPLNIILSKNVWSESECISIIQILKATKTWVLDLNSSCNSTDDTAFHLSARHHRLELVKFLLSEAGCDPNVRNHDGETPLSIILSKNIWSELECRSIIQMLKATKMWDLNSSCNSIDDTPLHLSARHHRPSLVQFLVSEAGCDPNVRNHDGETLLNLMLSEYQWSGLECTDTMKVLMATKQWDPNSSCNSEGDNALHLSAWHHRPTITQFLLSEAGCDPNIRNHAKETLFQLLMPAWSDSECVSIIMLMVTKMWNLNSSCNSKDDTALHLSVQHHRCRVTRFLISKADCDPNIRNHDGETPLNVMLSNCQWSDSECTCIIKLLMETKKCDPNSSCNSRSDTALHLSARHHRPTLIQFLLSEAGCDPNIRNHDEETLLDVMFSINLWSDLECIDVLMLPNLWNHSSSCNFKIDHDTALHLSIQHHRPRVTQYLVSKLGCDPNISRNHDRELLIKLMISNNQWSDLECTGIIKMITATKLWDPSSSSSYIAHDTVLHLSACHHRARVVQFLLSEVGCDPNIKNHKKETPLQLATHYDVIRLLICHGARVQSVSDIVSKLLMNSSTNQELQDFLCVDAIKVMIKYKQWDPHSICNSKGDTALHLSAQYHRPKVAHFLLSEARCDPNVMNYKMEIAIDQATHHEVIRSLICYGTRASGLTGLNDIVGRLLASSINEQESACLESITVTLEIIMKINQWNYNNSCCSNGDTALHFSARYHRPGLAHFLLSKAGCNPNVRNHDGKTPLQLATHCEVIISLICHGAKSSGIERRLLTNLKNDEDLDCLPRFALNVKQLCPCCNFMSDTVLHTSSQCHRTGIEQSLVPEAGCDHDLNVKKCDGETLPMVSKDLWSDLKCIAIINSLIVAKQWDPALSCDSKGDTALHLSVQHHRPRVTQFLLSEAGCDPNARNHNRETLLSLMFSKHTWSDIECTDIIRVLVTTKQWYPNSSCNFNGDTALHLSVQHHRPNVTQFLLSEAGCDPYVRNHDGETSLQLLISSWSDSECTDIMEMITEFSQWDPNVSCSSKGDTALHLSTQHYRPRVAHFLLSEADCDPNISNLSGETPLQLATHPEIIWLLIHHGARIQSGSNIVDRLLINSIKQQESVCLDTLKSIVETKQWDPNSMCNISGDTALHLSAQLYRPSVMEFLLSEVGCDSKIRNHDGETLLKLIFSNHKWLYSQCIDTIKILMATKQWDPNSSCNATGDTALHLSAQYHRPSIAQFLLSKANCDPKVRNHDGETPIKVMFSNYRWSDSECIDIIRLLIAIKQWDPQSSCNFRDDTVLHLSAQHCRLTVVSFLLSEANCNSSIRNLNGETPLKLMMATMSDSQCTDMIKILMATKQWDPNSSCTSKNDTALHLSAQRHKPGVAHFLLSEAVCDPNIKNNDAETSLQIMMTAWSDSTILKILKATKLWDPDSSCNSRGDTALHLSAKYHKPKVVHFLLSEAGCNPNAKNLKDETPLQLAYDIDVINELIRYGANPENVYRSHGKAVGLSKPLSPPVKVFIIGNSGVGKSTLTEALKVEASKWTRAFTTRKKVSGVDEKTAGIVPHDFESKKYGQVTFYDFAGQREFYSSHAAFLQNVIQASSPLFLVVVNLSDSIEEIQQNILYWLSFLENHCNSVHCKPHVIVIGSHADKVLTRGEDPQQRADEITESVKRVYLVSSLEYVGIYPLDCQYPESPGMTDLRHRLNESCMSVRMTNVISFNAHCFHVFLVHKFRMSVAVTIQDIQAEIITEEDSTKKGIVSFLPETTCALCKVCDELNDRGHILFLKNTKDIENSWVIVDKTCLLSKVTGTIFAPKDFKQHCQLTESTGVVPLCRLIEHFPDYRPDVLIGFLSCLEFCREILDHELHEMISKHQESLGSANVSTSNSERYFLFPGLITQEVPSNIWKDNYYFKYHCGWILQCVNPDQFFTSRFLQVLLLRLAFSFALVKAEAKKTIPALQRECSIWKNGIFWGEEIGMEIIVEVHPSNKAVILLIRCQEQNLLHCISQRSRIIGKILQCVQDFCSQIKTVESFIDPSETTQFPLKSISEVQQFSLQRIAEAVVKFTEYDSESVSVVSSTRTILLNDLLIFEPYAEMGASLLLVLNKDQSENKLSDKFLKQINYNLSKKADMFITMFKSKPCKPPSPATSKDLFAELRKWRDECEGTHKSLKKKLDQFSIFSGKNILVSMLPGTVVTVHT